jgi:hypothetical protein
MRSGAVQQQMELCRLADRIFDDVFQQLVRGQEQA